MPTPTPTPTPEVVPPTLPSRRDRVQRRITANVNYCRHTLVERTEFLRRSDEENVIIEICTQCHKQFKTQIGDVISGNGDVRNGSRTV